MTTHIGHTETGARFIHPALFYRSEQEYLATLVPFVTDGLAAGQPVAVAVPSPKLQLVRDGLGETVQQVTLVDMAREGRNPGRIIPRVLRRFADTHRDRHVRIVGEPIWADRTATEYPACAQHEALINTAFAGRDLTILCPYDTSALDERAIADARATHPLVWESTRRYRSEHYAPEAVLDRYNQPLPNTAPSSTDDHSRSVLRLTTLTELPLVRGFATLQARRLGLAAERMSALDLIASELACNSLLHTAGPCQLSIWREDGHLVCQAQDTGRLTDPLAGRRPPEPHRRHGAGLLMINDLADLVRVHTSTNGTTLRVHLRLNPA